MIVDGTNIKEWELKLNKKRIFEYFIKDSKFINVLIKLRTIWKVILLVVLVNLRKRCGN